jgi:multiple sugar transport system permease protein
MRKSSPGRTAALALLLIAAMGYLLMPPLWMLISSMSPDVELTVRPPHWIPHSPTSEHYRTLFDMPGANAVVLAQNPQITAFPKTFVNSFIVASCTVVLCVIFGSVAAYCLCRFVKPRLRKWILLGLLSSRMLPVASLIIPIYFALQMAGLLNTLTGLVLVYTGLLIPFVIWILEGYYRSFPTELEEAAGLDGCTPFMTFWRIVLPLSRNSLFAAGAFVFISVWSDFIVGLTLTTTDKAWPLSVALAQALNPINEPSWGLLNSAGIVAALVPAVLAFIFRGAVMRGMLSGAVKG